MSTNTFQNIFQKIDAMVIRITGVSEDMQRVTRGSDQIVLALSNISASVEESSAGLEEISSSAQVQAESLDQVALLGLSMRNIAERLMEATSSFNFREITVRCWNVMNCSEEVRLKCPAYQSSERKCWSVPGTWCGGIKQGQAEEKLHRCMNCKFFTSTISGIGV